MKKVITALQNENVNNKLSQYLNIDVIMNDILYKEGILEVLELNNNIDYIILSELLPGEISLKDLIKKIKEKNTNINIIIILENKNEELENYLLSKGKIKIFYNNEITVEDIIKIIDENYEKEKIEKELTEIKKHIKYNQDNKKEFLENIQENNLTFDEIQKIENEIEKEIKKENIIEKIKNKIINKKDITEPLIISIMGIGGVGKSTFTINLANSLKNKKILIIEINSKISEIKYLLNISNYEEIENDNFNTNINNKNELIKNNTNKNGSEIFYNKISINKNIDIITNPKIFLKENIIEILKAIKEIKNKYEIILIDIENLNKIKLNLFLKESNKIIFLIEPILLPMKKSIMLLRNLLEQANLEKEKINIVFNKVVENTISFNILRNALKEYYILGKINYSKKYHVLMNHKMKYKFLNKKLKLQYKKIAREIILDKNINKYYFNKIN